MQPSSFEQHAELTRAEHRLVCQLLLGRGFEEAARAEGVQVTTIRAHMRNVYLKTELHHLAAVIRWGNAHTGCCAFPQRERDLSDS